MLTFRERSIWGLLKTLSTNVERRGTIELAAMLLLSSNRAQITIIAAAPRPRPFQHRLQTPPDAVSIGERADLRIGAAPEWRRVRSQPTIESFTRPAEARDRVVDARK